MRGPRRGHVAGSLCLRAESAPLSRGREFVTCEIDMAAPEAVTPPHHRHLPFGSQHATSQNAHRPAAPVVSRCRCSFFAGNSITTSVLASGS